jgi:hypothetical protein
MTPLVEVPTVATPTPKSWITQLTQHVNKLGIT